jgi:hypothetical protein
MPSELSVLSAAIGAGNGPLPPFVAKLIKHAPESFDDQRAGQIAATVRGMRTAGEPVDVATVAKKLQVQAGFIAAELSAPLSPEAAEYYAPKHWNAYVLRQGAAIGEELQRSLKRSPEQAGAVIAAARAALEDITSESDTLTEKLATRIYSPANRPEEPIPRFFIAEVGVCTQDNLTAISAHIKAGKSATKGAMIASTFAGPEADCLGFKSENPHGFAVVDLDTEQSPFDHWQVMEQARRRAGAATAPPWLQSYRMAGLTVAEIRSAIPLAIAQAAKQFGGVHSVFIDGIADAAHDVNDAAEAVELVAELHGLAIKFHCPIIAIIHVNPGSDFKTRGHLGSQLERKSETNLRLEKDADGVTVIWADKNRRAPIPKATAPRFVWNEEAGMHTSIQSQKSCQEETDRETLTELATAVFSKRPSMRRMELETAVKNSLSVVGKTAERKVKRMLELGIIKKNIANLYTTTI